MIFIQIERCELHGDVVRGLWFFGRRDPIIIYNNGQKKVSFRFLGISLIAGTLHPIYFDRSYWPHSFKKYEFRPALWCWRQLVTNNRK